MQIYDSILSQVANEYGNASRRSISRRCAVTQSFAESARSTFEMASLPVAFTLRYLGISSASDLTLCHEILFETPARQVSQLESSSLLAALHAVQKTSCQFYVVLVLTSVTTHTADVNGNTVQCKLEVSFVISDLSEGLMCQFRLLERSHLGFRPDDTALSPAKARFTILPTLIPVKF